MGPTEFNNLYSPPYLGQGLALRHVAGAAVAERAAAELLQVLGFRF
jgi:hypothetical protein